MPNNCRPSFLLLGLLVALGNAPLFAQMAAQPLSLDPRFGCLDDGYGGLSCDNAAGTSPRAGKTQIRDSGELTVRHITPLSMGKSLATGTIYSGNKSNAAVWRLTTDGLDDASFGNDADRFSLSVSPIPGDVTSSNSFGVASVVLRDKIYALGHYKGPNAANYQVGVTRLNAAGVIDTTWALNGRWAANAALELGLVSPNDAGQWDSYATAIVTNGDFVFASGQVLNRATGETHAFVAKLNTAGGVGGVIDTSFGVSVDGSGTGFAFASPPTGKQTLPTALAIQGDRVLISGIYEAPSTNPAETIRSVGVSRHYATSSVLGATPVIRGGTADTGFSGDGKVELSESNSAAGANFSLAFKHSPEYLGFANFTNAGAIVTGQGLALRAMNTQLLAGQHEIHAGTLEGDTLVLSGWKSTPNSNPATNKNMLVAKYSLSTTVTEFAEIDFRMQTPIISSVNPAEDMATAVMIDGSGVVVAGNNRVEGTNVSDFTAARLLTDNLGLPRGFSTGGNIDFNDDTRGDLLWTNATATETELWAWVSNQTPDPIVATNAGALRAGLVLSGFKPYKIGSLPLGSPWRFVGAGDFNNDGVADILLRHSAGDMRIWFLDAALKTTPTLALQNNEPASISILADRVIGNVEPQFEVRGIGDIDNDGYDDIIFHDASGGLRTCDHTNVPATPQPASAYISFMGPGGVLHAHQQWGATRTNAWAICGVGDVNGDGRADIVWSNLTATTVNVEVALTQPMRAAPVEAPLSTTQSPNRVMLIGDFDGNGTADVFVRGGAQNQIWWVTSVPNGAPGSVPTVSVVIDTTVPSQLALINPVGQGNFKSNGLTNNLYLGNNVNHIVWRDSTNDVFAEWLMARPSTGIVSQQITSRSLRLVAAQPTGWKLLSPSVNRY